MDTLSTVRRKQKLRFLQIEKDEKEYEIKALSSQKLNDSKVDNLIYLIRKELFVLEKQIEELEA